MKINYEKEYVQLIDILTKFRKDQEVYYVNNECKVYMEYYLGYDRYLDSYVLYDGNSYEPEIITAYSGACFHTQREANHYALVMKRGRLEKELEQINKQIDEMGE
jgi:hypothetical protein